nr:hypothetical protein [uncultured Oscillibacter sp.]
MATVTKRGGSYRLRASVGYTPEGKQVMKSRTWTPDPGMTLRQIEKELNRQKVLFDEECRGSSLTDGHIKFEVFSGQWFTEYVEKTLGKRTQANYRQMAPAYTPPSGTCTWTRSRPGRSSGSLTPSANQERTSPGMAGACPPKASRTTCR